MLRNNYLEQAIFITFFLYLYIDVRVGGRNAKGNLVIRVNKPY